MGKLRDLMLQDLTLKGCAESTCCEYLRCVRDFAAYHWKSPADMGELEVRQFMLYLATEKKAAPSTRKVHLAALKFCYGTTLRRPDVCAHMPWPKVQYSLPDILSGSEVDGLLGAMTSTMHRAVVMTAYGSGLRISEACRLQVGDIDSQRMVIHVRLAKGGRDRFVQLPERVLFTLRQYWATEHPKGPYLFPGQKPGRTISVDAVRSQLHKAAAKAGVVKRVTPHILRHTFATHLLELGTDIRVIQMLLGHRSIRTTLRYTQVTKEHIARTQSPVDVLGTPAAKKAIG